jgi:hypothetical protein
VVVAACALPGVAEGTVLCVPTTSIPGCPATGSAQESNLQQATKNGQSGDEILIATGTFNGPLDTGVKSFQIVGAGEGQTVIQGAGSPVVNLSAGSTLSNVTLNLYSTPGDVGLNDAGAATNVAVTATGFTSTNPVGVQLVSGGTFSDGSITLPLSATEDAHYAGVIGSGTVSDSSITAPVGAGTDFPAFTTPTLTRDTVAANQGVLAGANGPSIDDSLIRTVPGAAPEMGIGTDPDLGSGTFAVRHDTIIGSSGVGSTGVLMNAFAAATPATGAATLESSIVRGYATSVSAVSDDTAFPAFLASATVTIQHSFYDPTTASTHATGAQATATITADAASGNHDPLFVDPAGGNYHLQAGSPAIDAGEPTIASGESSTDLDGNPRAVTGHNGNGPATDVGAYEFQPHAPTASAIVGSSSVTVGTPDTFAATGGDASPNDAVSFTWSFDDGGSATGASVMHIFTTPGPHSATVTVTDLDGFTATAHANLTVTLPKPRLSKLKVKPKALRNRHKATVTYVDSEPGTVRFTVQRFKGHRKFVNVGAFTHKSVAGPNRLTYRPRKLRPGRYRIVAIPTDSAGAGPSASARFTIKKIKKKR